MGETGVLNGCSNLTMASGSTSDTGSLVSLPPTTQSLLAAAINNTMPMGTDHQFDESELHKSMVNDNNNNTKTNNNNSNNNDNHVLNHNQLNNLAKGVKADANDDLPSTHTTSSQV